MSSIKPYVTIKGTKDGLIFSMDDTCAYQDLITELKEKLNYTHHRFLQSMEINRVTIKLGYRYLSEEQMQEVKEVIHSSKGNLIVDKLESELVSKTELDLVRQQTHVQVIYRTIRSGQISKSVGNVLILGDVNPGGCVEATGNIYVLGALRGMAHAGSAGDEQAIIVASSLRPTQLRIANTWGRSPDNWEDKAAEEEFAYLDQGQIVVEKMHHLAQVRPHI